MKPTSQLSRSGAVVRIRNWFWRKAFGFDAIPSEFRVAGSGLEKSPDSKWWLEKEFFLLMTFLFAAMMVRLGDAPLRGEEPRRAEVAVEMRYFGDWVVPRQYGEPFTSRPPLHSWMLAAAEAAFNSHSRWVLRFPSVLCVLLTSGLIYGYARRFLTRVGASTAGLVYTTCGEVLVQSQLAETEPAFVLFLAAGLMVWHWGYVAAWRPAMTWAAAYGLESLAGLCKGGLQPQVYLLGTAGLYLLWKGNLRFLLSWGHAAGIAVGVAIAAAWAVPCAELVDWPTTKKIWMSDTTMRFFDWKLDEFLWHLVKFPSEVVGCLMPWGLLGGAFLFSSFRRRIVTGPDCILYCGLAFVVAAPTVWLPPGGHTRYLVPIYPCLAVLYGAAVDWIAEERANEWAWRQLLMIWVGILAGLAGLVLVGIWAFPDTALEGYALSPAWGAGYAAVLLALAAIMAFDRHSRNAAGLKRCVWAIAAGAVVVNLGPVTDARLKRINDLEAKMAEVRPMIPADSAVYAVHGVNPAVPYLLGRREPLHPVLTPAEIPSGAYFCINCENRVRPALPFAWDAIAEVVVDRMKNPTPECTVIIARRRPSSQ